MTNVRSLNRVILVGRVGTEPEISHIPNIDRDVGKFSLATNEGYMDKNNQWQENTEWHNIVGWGPIAKKIEKNVAKGSLVLIEGKLRTRKWKDQNDQQRYKTEVEIANLVVLDKSAKNTSAKQNVGEGDDFDAFSGNDKFAPRNQQPPVPEKDINDADFPFDESSDPF